MSPVLFRRSPAPSALNCIPKRLLSGIEQHGGDFAFIHMGFWGHFDDCVSWHLFIQLLEYTIPPPPRHKNPGGDISGTKRATRYLLVSFFTLTHFFPENFTLKSA